MSFTWDALSRNLTQAGPQGTASYTYDAAGRRTQLTYPGTGLFVNTDYLVTGEVTKVRENGATTGVGVLATYTYDNLGNRLSTTFGNGAVQAFTFDPVSRLSQLTNDLSGTTNDLTATFAYSPASQIASTVRTGDTYAWTGHGNGSTAFVQNGLNQQTNIGGAAAAWDTKGNLVTEPQTAKTYGYSSENLLTSTSGGVTLGYDPLLRLYNVNGATTTRFAYDGLNAIAEYNATNALQRRFVFGPGVDEVIVQYEGTGTTSRRFMSSDERGSVISLTDNTGVLLNLNRYDEYGKPQSTNVGRFQYTGQKWIAEAGLYDYKFRDYLPHLGIFAQTDPIRQAGGVNLYAYVGGDPVNWTDPLGLFSCPPGYDTVPIPDSTSAGNGADGGVIITAHNTCRLRLETYSPNGGNRGEPGGGVGGDGNDSEEKPKYCSSVGYRIGDFVDKLGGTTQDVGTGVVIGGLVAGVATAVTGVGAGAGAAIAGVGGSIYAGGTGLSAVGNGIKSLNGQSGLVTMISLLSLPTARLNPVSQIVTEKTLSYFVNKDVKDPCEK